MSKKKRPGELIGTISHNTSSLKILDLQTAEDDLLDTPEKVRRRFETMEAAHKQEITTMKSQHTKLKNSLDKLEKRVLNVEDALMLRQVALDIETWCFEKLKVHIPANWHKDYGLFERSSSTKNIPHFKQLLVAYFGKGLYDSDGQKLDNFVVELFKRVPAPGIKHLQGLSTITQAMKDGGNKVAHDDAGTLIQHECGQNNLRFRLSAISTAKQRHLLKLYEEGVFHI